MKNETSSERLRKLAEEMVRRKAEISPRDAAKMTPEKTWQTLYELRVHQIELEIQNEELRRVQLELEASKARYFDFYNLAPVGYCTISTKGVFREVSLTFASQLGVTSHELFKKPLNSFIFGADQDRYYLFMKALLTIGETQVCELRLVKADQTTFWVKLVANLASGAHGTVECRLVVSDISERKKAEQYLLESEERFKLLAEQNRVFHWEVDTRGLYTYISDVCTTVLGFQPQELINKKHFYDLHPEQGREEFKKAALEVFARQEKFVNLENRVQTAAGWCIWVSTTGIPILDDQGKLTGYRGTDTDISARKLAEEKYSALFNNSVDTILIADPPSRRFVDCNKAAELLTGYSRSELLSMHADNLHPPDRLAETTANFKKMAAGIHLFVETEILTKDSQRIPVEITSSAIAVESGNYIIGLFKNISKRKRAEEQQRLYQSLVTATLESTADGILVIDNAGRITLFNSKFAELLQVPTSVLEQNADAELLKHALTQLTDPEEFLAKTRELYTTPAAISRDEIRFTDGHIFERYSQPQWLGDKIVGRVWSFRDITDKKLDEEHILHLSFHDVLTGLYNRRFFEEELVGMDTARQLPISIISGDVNGLKLTNDVFGHARGDEMILAAAQSLQSCCRAEDIVVRYGGDEFMVFLPKCDEKTTLEIVDRIHAQCRNKTVAGIPVSLALGVATKEEPTEDINTIVNLAETRMYKNKSSDVNRIRLDTLEALERTVNEKDYKADHALRLQEVATDFGKYLQLPVEMIADMALLATLHDIGKIAIAEEIINKQGPLNSDEWELIKTHPEVGNRILRATRMVSFAVEQAVLMHHEHWDGSGYPNGLRAETVPLISRAVAIIDAYDVMTHDRPYHRASTHEQAIAELQRCAGSQFDPELVTKFVEFIGKSQLIENS